jgi:hypothetical protein
MKYEKNNNEYLLLNFNFFYLSKCWRSGIQPFTQHELKVISLWHDAF